jgi:hypothetical protein
VLDRDDLAPPVIAGAAQLRPLVGHDLVEGIFHQAGEVGGGGELHAVGVVAAVHVIVAGERVVQLADAGQAVNLQVHCLTLARGAQQVVERGLELVSAVEQAVHTARPLHHGAAGERGHQAALRVQGGGERGWLEDLAGKLPAHEVLRGRRQMRGGQAAGEEVVAHLGADGLGLENGVLGRRRRGAWCVLRGLCKGAGRVGRGRVGGRCFFHVILLAVVRL